MEAGLEMLMELNKMLFTSGILKSSEFCYVLGDQ